MNHIEKLIDELCPNGVEYVQLNKLVNYSQPTKYLVGKTDYSDEFSTPVLTPGQTFILGYTDDTEGVYPATPDNSVIIFDDFTTAFKWVNFPFKLKSSAAKILTPSDQSRVDFRFVYYAMRVLGFQAQDHQRHWIRIFGKLQIPVPPLEVQLEIVKVLDLFTKLEAELEAELVARRKQYEYYRDQLLTFPEDGGAPWVKLGALGAWTGGGTPSKANAAYWNAGDIPWVSPKDMRSTSVSSTIDQITKQAVDESTANLVSSGSILVVFRSGILEKKLPVAEARMDVAINQDMKALTVKDGVNRRFVMHSLLKNDSNIRSKAGNRGGSVSSLVFKHFKNYAIPLPPLSEQKRIAEILDKFDALVNDLESGLPAEIEARRKQYEYYRDKLLTFKELEPSA